MGDSKRASWLAVLPRLLDVDAVLAGATLVSMTGVAVVGVFYRFVLNDPLLWSDEVVKLLFTWFCFTGMSVVAKRGAHLRMDIFDFLLTLRIAGLLRLGSNAVVLTILLVLLVNGIELSVSQAGNQFASLPISRAWSFAALPVGAVLMVGRLLPLMLADVRGLRVEP
jgi:TRAP-type C4-dicarboxylate transport system permease small subunit